MSSIVALPDAYRLITVTPTVLNADAYDANDTLFDSTLVPNAVGAADRAARLDSICWLDKDDQTAANLVFWFLSANVAFGTADAAPSISDANALNILGAVPFASSLILDVGGAKCGSLQNIGLIIAPASGTANIYVACTTAGTPTHTTGGVQLRLGFRST
jgi:hypothetical protein